ncbi:hypothetical protein KBB49_03995 [Candidatus Saccharibacteria bacterium]|nr:hypothetical protein [Candidatus Saccharibacteria bacterium]
MNEQFDQLVDYIRQHLNQGVAEDHIRQTLSQHNWNADLVDRAFLSVKAPQTPYPPALSYSESNATNQPSNANANNWEQSNITQAQAPSAYEHASQVSPEPNAPKKYKVFRAIGDTFQAIKNNAGAFFLSVILSYIVAAVFLFIISFIVGKVLYGEFGLLFASTSKLLTVLLGSLVLYTAWYALAGAFILATTSLALYDGSENRKSSLSTILSNSFSRLGRVVLADILFCLVAFWPIVLIIFLPIIFLTSGVGGSNSSLILLPILMLVAVIWIYIALVRFALAPYVALFEPNIPITKTLGRSKHLLVKGGQWFLVKGFLFLLLILILLAVVTGQNLPELMDSNNLVINIFLIIVSVVVNGSLVMLYHNRKIIRG